MTNEFTGKHMAAIFVAGFGIVMAVNFFMAGLATGGFSGVVVKNSYVASQNYNEWLRQAAAQKALGWEAAVSRGHAGRLQVATRGVPANAVVEARIERPLGNPDPRTLVFAGTGGGMFKATTAVPQGRWIVRLRISRGQDAWHQRSEIR